MRYSLTVYNKSKFHDIKDYTKIPGFEHIEEQKIKGIIDFTNQFDSEYDLLDYLLENELIPEEFSNGTLGIHFYKNKTSEPKLLQYGISFQEDKKYFDTIFLQYYYQRMLQNPQFMEAFIKKYYEYLKNVPIFQEELKYLRYSYNHYVEHGYLPDHSIGCMGTFVTLYCRKKGKDGEYKADFTKIRDLAMFAIDFERKNNRTEKHSPKFTIRQITNLITHYENILEDGNVTDEQRDVYIEEINKLEYELKCAEQLTLNRRKKDETTRN